MTQEEQQRKVEDRDVLPLCIPDCKFCNLALNTSSRLHLHKKGGTSETSV